MLEQSTDRMWYLMAIVIIGAVLFLTVNGVVPELFGHFTDQYVEQTSD